MARSGLPANAPRTAAVERILRILRRLMTPLDDTQPGLLSIGLTDLFRPVWKQRSGSGGYLFDEW
jgi:hypothetical protein